MELENLKQSWQDYDQKLNDTLKLNETLLKQLNLDKSKRELGKPLTLEIMGMLITLLLLVILFGVTRNLATEANYLISGIIAIVLCLVLLLFSIIRVKRFTEIDYYNSPVVLLQKQVAVLKRTIMRYRKLEFILLPPLLVALYLLAFKVIHHIDLFQNIPRLVLISGTGTAICYVAVIWINRQLYDKKLQNTEQFLKEIESFEAV